MLPLLVGLLKLMLNIFHTISIEGRELADFLRYTYNIGLCPKTPELTYVKVCNDVRHDKTIA